MANLTGKKFGGRPKGGLNKDKKELKDRLNAKFPDWCPVEQMAGMAIELRHDPDERQVVATCCKEVAQYIYPKLKAMEVSGEVTHDGKIVVEWLKS